MSASANPYLLTLPQLLSAKKKIGKVASTYDPKEDSFRGFDCSYLTPVQFRHQLRRNFLIELTDSELGAVVFLFDKNGDGRVDSAEFINEFYKLGKMEKERFQVEHQIIRKRMAEKEKQRLDEYSKRLSKLGEVKVATTWTPEDEQSGIRKIAKVAFAFDKNKGGLEAFQNAPALAPGEFRMLMRLLWGVIHLKW